MAKVAEFQARGVVPFHASVRLDGPELADPPPAGGTTDVLCEAVRRAVAAARVRRPNCSGLGEIAQVVWGEQLDLRPVLGHDGGGQLLTDGQVAGYLAKYSVKGAEASGTVDRPIACRQCKGSDREAVGDRKILCDRCGGHGSREKMRELSLPGHVKTMIDTCWRLGGIAELEELRLRPWAHMLGFRGHFSTKSRRYSTTLGCLRDARHQWRSARVLAAHGLDPATALGRCKREDLSELVGLEDEGDTVLVVGDWRYTGRGHSLGQAVYAASIREDLAEGRRIWHQVRHDEDWTPTPEHVEERP
jgi:hypothetical protein